MKSKANNFRSHDIIWPEIKEQYPFAWSALVSFIEEFRYHHTFQPGFQINDAFIGHPTYKLHLIFEGEDDGFLSHNDLLYMFDNHKLCIVASQLGAYDKWTYVISNWNDNETIRSEKIFKERWEAEIAAINKCFELLEKKLKALNSHLLN